MDHQTATEVSAMEESWLNQSSKEHTLEETEKSRKWEQLLSGKEWNPTNRKEMPDLTKKPKVCIPEPTRIQAPLGEFPESTT